MPNFQFSTTSNSKVITLERVGGVINVNVLDGGLEFQPLLSELGSYITFVADAYYTEGLFSIVDSSISFEFTGFSGLGCIDIGGMQWDLNYNTFGSIEYIGEPHTHLLSGNGNRLSLYAPAYFDIVGASSGTVDFSPILSAISVAKTDILNSVSGIDLSPAINAVTIAKTEILNNVPVIDLTPIEASLTTIKGYTDTLEADLLILQNGISGVVNNSLNGIGCEFKDGALVTVDGRDTIFTVKRSSFSLLDDATYTAFYDLQYPSGETLSAPESLLTRYVSPVTTP